MRLSLSITTDKDRSDVEEPDSGAVAVPDLSSAWSIVTDAWAKAHASDIDEQERDRRQNWVGGAIRVFAEVSGRDPVEVRDSLPKIDVSGGVPQPYRDLGITFVPTKPGRPDRHPGAQRPVAPVDDLHDVEHFSDD